MHNLTFSWKVEPESQGKRLDVFLAEQCREDETMKCLSRTRIQELIREGHIHVNNMPQIKPNYRLTGQEEIILFLPEPEPLDLEPEPIPLDILFEDDDLAVIDKPAGMVVHPSGRTTRGTLVNALLYHLKNLSGIGGIRRPGIVHRLDRGTSGLILVAKNDEAHIRLSTDFKMREISKTYIALVQGRFQELAGVIDFPLARHRSQPHKMAAIMKNYENPIDSEYPGRKVKAALTRYQVTKDWPDFSQILVNPETGRTHQIRVHLSQIGHPVLGDLTYGYEWEKNRKLPKNLIHELNGPALHALEIKLSHPRTKEPLHFKSKIPPRIQNIIDYLDQLSQNYL